MMSTGKVNACVIVYSSLAHTVCMCVHVYVCVCMCARVECMSLVHNWIHSLQKKSHETRCMYV